MPNSLTTEQAWTMLLNRYSIVQAVQKNGIYPITAAQIKEYREPRLMAKWDSSTVLPDPLKNNNLNILATSRSSYVIGDFKLYQSIPKLTERVEHMTPIKLDAFDTIDINNIASESIATNVLVQSGVLDNFLGTKNLVPTISGRMGTAQFDFNVDTFSGTQRKITVNHAQCEIDGGFENNDNVVLLEAKNVVPDDFNIRQLYYPYRLWNTRVHKPIRLVFSIYSNMIYRLFEYRFNTLDDYSSIAFVRTKNYTLQDIDISVEDLVGVRKNTKITTSDNMTNTIVPFVQADSMERVISLLENMKHHPMTREQVIYMMQFVPRQYGYYTNAGVYLGIFSKDDQAGTVELTPLGRKLCLLPYKPRQLGLVGLVLRHQIFAEMFDVRINTGEIPDKRYICNRMHELNVCRNSQSTLGRRAQSVSSWIKWMFRLTELA